MNAVFPINKPSGPTCAALLNSLKKKCSFEKVGHGGTLDPIATGVLVIGLNRGCKELSRYLKGNKEYRVLAKLGESHDTFDRTGYLLRACDYSSVSELCVQKSLSELTGLIMQKPPRFSAIKVNGKRAYELARNEQIFDIPARQVMIDSIQLSFFKPPFFEIIVKCGSGTYVRSLVNDIGARLGIGASVYELERCVQGPFKLHDCLDTSTLSVDDILKEIKRFSL